LTVLHPRGIIFFGSEVFVHLARIEDALNDIEPNLYAETIHKMLQFHRVLFLYSRRMQVAGISGRKLAALRYLLEAGPRTIGELRDYHHISDSTTSEMMSQLERCGYVTRSRSEVDNRVVVVELTPTGQEFAQSAPLGGIPLLREKLKEMTPERLSVIEQALTELLSILDAAENDATGLPASGQEQHGCASVPSVVRES
jgi:DNA-binding MarR family transcriptional regulator